jgi:hypothetical protein
MRDGSIFAAFYASECGGAWPPSTEALRIWASALTGLRSPADLGVCVFFCPTLEFSRRLFFLKKKTQKKSTPHVYRTCDARAVVGEFTHNLTCGAVSLDDLANFGG